MKTKLMILSGVALLLAVAPLHSGSQPEAKLTPVGIKIEAEEPNLSWPTSTKRLSSDELQSLQSLVAAELAKQPSVKIVPLDYSEDYIGVVVVAARLRNGHGGQWYIASSAFTIAFKDGKEGFVSHNVLVASDVAGPAKAVGYQFASMRLQPKK